MLKALIYFFLSLSITSCASTGKWASKVTKSNISYKVTDSNEPIKDFTGNYLTVIYLENLMFNKIGQNSHKEDVAWLLSQAYRVIELDYAKNKKASPININQDIIAINNAIASGEFCGIKNCSTSKSYILFEGYRIARNVPYFEDDPAVYNTPTEYIKGDMLHMDIIYPANAIVKVPTVLSFSYSNSYATYDANKKELTDAHKDFRMFLPYTFAGFNDSFLEGAPAHGMAWAIADHPKYAAWGSGKPSNGKNDTYKSYQVNPDAAQKVKSAIRTLRAKSEELGLSGKIGIYGFSRGASAGSMAIGDKTVAEFENTGFNIGINDDVQAAALGPGVFDYTQIYNTTDDGDSNLEIRCPWAWGRLKDNYELWQTMGASFLVESSKTAPTLFFYNTNDDAYYHDQITHFKAKLDSLNVPTSMLINYGIGHAVPQTTEDLNELYNFFKKHLKPSTVEVIIKPNVVSFIENKDNILNYQITEKSLNGAYKRSNYIHPLYTLDGDILTEDFPEDHPHHRGIFWAWHQLFVGDKRIGDGWEIQNFSWDVTSVEELKQKDASKAIEAEVLWKSNQWLDVHGNEKPLVKETTTIKVYPKEKNYRQINIEISLLALEENIRIGGSEDAKGYGGFSPRIKLTDDVIFTSSEGQVTPTNLPLKADSWMDISGAIGKDGKQVGLTILCHPNNPQPSNQWILRTKRSMQNAVYPYPGAIPVPLSTIQPTILRYCLIVHNGSINTIDIPIIYKDYIKQ
ncbi:DUF6807 family protein [Mariniflexile litorale]|uniref:DUF6807 family protein n=1 Tax=Mariniflexile litorale TaxID=3045158 RepID=A0AAU7EGX0_9FLAO|nr:DUF6807 family protein [Mariniflexile sp. KMM 9835]MDQ8210339.1 PmoA family protein [Mariniflexile sp. KMM 9835]